MSGFSKRDFSKQSQSTKGPRDADTSEGMTPTGGPQVDASPTIRPDEYAEALEMRDAGVRLAVPQLTERVSADEAPAPAPEIDSDVAFEMGTDLMEARAKLVSAGGRIRLAGNGDLHRRLNETINEVDRIGAMLAERHSS